MVCRYCFTLPYLVWKTPFPMGIKLLLLAGIEVCWNVYPPTAHASLALAACHVALLVGLIRARMDSPGPLVRAKR